MVLQGTVITDAGLPEMPGEKDFLAVMRPQKFDMPFFKVAEKTTHGEDRLDILGEVLDRFFKRMNAVLQIIFLFQKPVRAFGRANQLMHKKKIVGTAVGLFFGPEELQAFFKFGE